MENTTSCFHSEIIPQAFRDGMKVAHFVTISGKPVLMPSVTIAFRLGNDNLRSALLINIRRYVIRYGIHGYRLKQMRCVILC